jgi:hypothetical protein
VLDFEHFAIFHGMSGDRFTLSMKAVMGYFKDGRNNTKTKIRGGIQSASHAFLEGHQALTSFGHDQQWTCCSLR